MNQTGLFTKIVLNEAENRWFEEFWKDNQDTIMFQVANLKTAGSKIWHRYEKYKKSRHVVEMKKLVHQS